MGQKANPISLRSSAGPYRGTPYWGQPKFSYIVYAVHKLIRACCKNSDIYLNKILITSSHQTLIVHVYLLQIFSESNKKRLSRRYGENIKSLRKKKFWADVLKKFYLSQTLIQKFTGYKSVKFKIRRTKLYTRSIPRSVRQSTNFYSRGFNRVKYGYARAGVALIVAALNGTAGVDCLASFIRDNIRTRSRRRKHTDFFRFLKQVIDAAENGKSIRGIRVQVRGRFGHKPKGRSKIWKYQMGPLPLSKIEAPIQARYRQAQTKLGSVGIKVWIYQ